MEKIMNKCSICGGLGHKKSSHDLRPSIKKCCCCKKEKTIDCFRLYKKRINIDTAPRYQATCIDCDKEKSKNRYRSTVKARLGYLLASAKSRTKNTNMEFDIDLDFLCNLYKKQQGLCFYSKRKMLLEIGKWAISIDRRDSNKGYNKDNIVLVCWFVNNMKNNIQEIEFINICTEIVNNVNNTRLQFMWS
mgnify:CR=1 FL=1